MATTFMETPNTVEQPPQRGACVEFVKFCKEQHLRAQAAETFIRVLHNHAWQMECERIREAMRPEIDKLFAPIERDIARGANCQELLRKLVILLTEHKMGS
jgi:hypothetical protein